MISINDAVLVHLSRSSGFITMSLYSPAHGKSPVPFVFSEYKLNLWLEAHASHYDEGDGINFIMINRTGDYLDVSVSFIVSSEPNGSFTGYRERFYLRTDDIIRALHNESSASIGTRSLTPSAVKITQGARSKLASADRRTRRAFIRRISVQSGEGITLYPDWDDDYYFCFGDDRCIDGSFAKHVTRVIGKDGKPHEKLVYSVYCA